jgi:hypothetical protein
VAAAIKPFLLPLVAWLAWRRRLDAVGAATVVAASLAVVGVMVFGLPAYAEWRQGVQLVDWYPRSLNASLWGGTYRLLVENPQFAHLAVSERTVQWVMGVTASAVVVATWWACRVFRDIDREWSIVVCASLLLSPLGWVYYGVWLLPGMAFRWPGRIATACWLVPTPFLIVGQPSLLATALWGSAATWGLLLTFVHIARSGSETRAPEAMAAP